MKYKYSKQLTTITFSLLTLVATGAAQAASTFLSGDISVDNMHTTYLSTSNSSAGTEIVNGSNWGTTDSFDNVELTEDQDYFLHIRALDAGGIAGFLGDFSLAGTGHVFANGETTITSDTANWLVSTSGWSDYVAATEHGSQGDAPWGTRANIDTLSTWIWSSDSENDNIVFFSLAITATPPSAVPVPAALFLFAPALLGFLGFRRKMKS